MTAELIVGLVTNLPNLAGLLLLAWFQNRMIDRLFKDNDRNEKDVKENRERIRSLENGLEYIRQSVERLNLTLRDLMLTTLHDDTKPPQS